MAQVRFEVPTALDRAVSTAVVLIALIVIVAAGFLVLEHYGIWLYLLIVAGTIVLLISWHSKTRGYRCGNCGHEFEISFRTDLLTANSFRRKMLTCPQCRFRDYADELIKKKTFE